MTLKVLWNTRIKNKFPDLRISALILSNVTIIETPIDIINQIEQLYFSQIKEIFNLENLKNNIQVRAYRDFYWSIDIDPTKTRPASEALVRRILANKPLWRINSFVDSYNIASAVTLITLGAYDLNSIQEETENIDLNIRMSKTDEEFQGIGMKESKLLKGKELIVESNNKIICIYPYRDAYFSRIRNQTKKILLLAYGVPQISSISLKESLELTIKIYKNFDKTFQSSDIQLFVPKKEDMFQHYKKK